MSRFFLDPRTARATWTILVFVGALGLLYAMRGVLLIVALSLFFAYLLFPLVRLTQRWLIQSRPLAIVVVYLVVLAALGGAVVAVGPRLSTEVQSLAQQLPDMSKQIQSGELVRGLLARKGWEGQQIREIDRLVQTHMGEIIGYAQQGAAALLTWLAGAWVIVLVPIFAFFTGHRRRQDCLAPPAGPRDPSGGRPGTRIVAPPRRGGSQRLVLAEAARDDATRPANTGEASASGSAGAVDEASTRALPGPGAHTRCLFDPPFDLVGFPTQDAPRP